MDSRFSGNDNIIIQSLEYSKYEGNLAALIRGKNVHETSK